MKIYFLFLFLVSCGSVMVTEPTTSQYAPKNYKGKGMIKYLNNGADSIIKERREDAFKNMYEKCNGKYSILNESDVPPDGHEVGGFNYWYLTFQCES
jgi:hypothetical protein